MAAIAEILSRDAITPVDTVDKDEDGKLTVADLVRMFEESEDASYQARKDAERDRDYHDNKQHTAAELATLAKRGQPPAMDNRIKTKVDYLVGLEKQQRIDPIARPRTPIHEQEANSATEALRYVADAESYDNKRSGVWRNMLVEGAGGISVSVAPEYGKPDELCIKLSRTPWDRMFWDPHSAETDFSDAGYLGLVLWNDISDAYRRWPGAEAKEVLDTTMSSAPSDTYDDKPKFNHWADKKRKRVRVCQIWIKKAGENGEDEWHFAEFTKGGILKAGPSPHKTDKGESDGELFFQSAYVDRDNNRYSLVREMISLQDGINKRKSKALHLISVHQTTYENGAIPNIEEFRKQKARPDGTMEVAPGALKDGRIVTETRVDLAQAHMLLLQDDKNAIDLKGPNATAMGDKAQGSSAASGRAILASQQGGMVSLGDLLDNLRHLDRRVFRAIWNRIRQYWTGQKWIRVTDDEVNVKWVGVNVDPQQVQMAMQQNPEMQGKIAGVIANVAELDCDIIIDEVPDVILAQEQFQQLLEMKQYDAENEIPFRELILASSIKDKQKFVQAMDKRAAERQQSPEVQQAKQVEMAGAVAQVKETESKATLNMAKAREAMTPEAPDMMQPQRQEFEIPPQLQVAQAAADLEHTHAQTDEIRTKTALAPAKMQQDARMKEQALQQRAQQAKQMAARRPQQAAR
jgi:hypothetical protein